MQKEILSGNEAIARGAYEFGARCATAYPGTPSTEILENIRNYKEIYAEWSPNEKVAFEVAFGASVAGGRAITAMKHVGLNVAADPFMTSAYTGVNAGFIVVSADDPQQHSSQNEQDNRRFAYFGKVPCLEPSDSQEAKDLVGVAFDLSETCDIPVMLRITTRIAHSSTVVTLGERRDIPKKDYERNVRKFNMMPAFSRERRIDLDRRFERLRQFSNSFAYNRIEARSGEMGIVTSGIAYQYAREAFPDASILKITLSNPVPDQLIRTFASMVKVLYVIEEVEPYLEEQIRQMGIPCIGKDKIPSMGELSTDIVRTAIQGGETEFTPPVIPDRPPVLCPGCSHRGFFTVAHNLKLVALGDIGCYTLGGLPPLNGMDTCLCMGASIGQAIGFSKVYEGPKKNKIVAVIGDSTFVHSGITGLIDAVYNKANVVICILDNGTTAMTGHQEHPGTGKTIQGEPTTRLDYAKLCEAIGVPHFRTVDPLDLKATRTALKEALAFDGPAVLVFQAPCIIRYRTRAAVYSVDSEKCEACNLCFAMGCPAITKDGEERAEIDPLLCAGCTLCEQVCKKAAINLAETEPANA